MNMSGGAVTNQRTFWQAVGAAFVAWEMIGGAALAATWQWDGGAGTGNWQTGDNWSPNGSIGNFNGTFADRLNVNGAQELIYSAAEGSTRYGAAGARGVVIGSGSAGSGTMRITGGTFSTLNANQADVVGNSSGNTGTLIVDGGMFVSSSAGLALGIGGGPTSVLTINGGTTTVTTLSFYNTTGIVNLNGGTLVVNTFTRTGGDNTFNFNGGTYEAAATLGLSGMTAANVLAGGAVFDSADFDITLDQTLLDGGGGGGLTKLGAGRLIVNADQAFTGGVSIDEGVIKMSSRKSFAVGVGVNIESGAAWYLEGTDPTVGELTGGGDIGSTWVNSEVDVLTVGSGNASSEFSGVIAGGDNGSGTLSGISLVKTGSGTLTLSGNNSYWGTTTVNAGEVLAAHANALGSGANGTTVANGARVVLTDGITVSGESITIAGHGGNARGALQAASGATATWDGPVVLQSGDTRVGAQANGTLIISGAITNGTSSELLVSADATTGKVIVSGSANTYSYATRVVRGTLQLGGHNALSTAALLDIHSASSVPDAAYFEMNGFNQWVAGLKRGNTSGPATLRNSSLTTCVLTLANVLPMGFDSPIQGNLSLVKEGVETQTLSGNNTYTGGTTVNDGTLLIAATAALPTTTTVRINDPGTLQLNANASAERLYLDGQATPAGTWGASGSGAEYISDRFLGSGILTVAKGSPGGTLFLIR